MSNIVKLNGYDIKDATARGNITTLETTIGDLTNLTTTDKSSVVSAINEVDSAVGTAQSSITEINGDIGDLTNLTTTNKTDTVSAINEVNAKINLFDLTSYTTFGYSDITMTNCSSTNIYLYTAVNSDGSIAKIYGSGNIDVTDTNDDIELSIQTSLRPSENIIISGSVIALGNTNGGNTGYIQIKTTGEVVVTIFASANNNLNVILPPCIYFIKNFGDINGE